MNATETKKSAVHASAAEPRDEYEDLAWGMLAAREDATEHWLESIRAWG